MTSQAWWCTPIILALRRQRKEDHEFEASLGYILSQKTKQKQISLHCVRNKNNTNLCKIKFKGYRHKE
jgi:hypothetical protein